MGNKKDKEYLPMNKASQRGLLAYLRWARPLRKIPGARAGANTILRTTKKLLINSYTFLKGRRVVYDMRGLITDKNCDFMKDAKFLEGYTAAMGQIYFPEPPAWQAHVNQWAAFHAKQLTGDFVECGVNRGFYSMSNMTYIDFKSLKNRKYYLFDTFCGLDPEFCTKEEYLRTKDIYQNCYQFVVDSFKKFPNVVIVKGPVPKTLSQVDIKKVAYLSIDMNCAFPEVEALKYFWPKLEPGGIVVLDDYGWPGAENQKKAADDFASSVGVRVLSLPTGQGMLIKPG
jgi:O-methyltransferase